MESCAWGREKKLVLRYPDLDSVWCLSGRVGPCGVDHACPGRRETSRNDTGVAERSIRDVGDRGVMWRRRWQHQMGVNEHLDPKCEFHHLILGFQLFRICELLCTCCTETHLVLPPTPPHHSSVRTSRIDLSATPVSVLDVSRRPGHA